MPLMVFHNTATSHTREKRPCMGLWPLSFFWSGRDRGWQPCCSEHSCLSTGLHRRCMSWVRWEGDPFKERFPWTWRAYQTPRRRWKKFPVSSRLIPLMYSISSIIVLPLTRMWQQAVREVRDVVELGFADSFDVCIAQIVFRAALPDVFLLWPWMWALHQHKLSVQKIFGLSAFGNDKWTLFLSSIAKTFIFNRRPSLVFRNLTIRFYSLSDCPHFNCLNDGISEQTQ